MILTLGKQDSFLQRALHLLRENKISNFLQDLEIHLSADSNESTLESKGTSNQFPCLKGTLPIVFKLFESHPTIQWSSCGNPAFLLGDNKLSTLKIAEWIKLCTESQDSVTAIGKRANSDLENANFLVSNNFSLADLFVWIKVEKSLVKLNDFPNVLRWFSLIQEIIKVDSPIEATTCQLQATTIQPEKPKKEKKEKPKAPAVTPKVDERPLICQVDVRVGKICSVMRHPDADALYVEEVDLGEGRRRTIVSGLANHLPLEALQDRLALFVCNLKPASLRGIKSEGMILATTSAEGKVNLVSVPEDSLPGERAIVKELDVVLFGATEELLNPKKKIIETVKETLKTNNEGIVTCPEGQFYIQNRGFATGEPNCTVG
jgi:aminoacyl tRNA synthase complex-interacting multifunctional protein 1